jgi:D-glycero-alpha-D-manno-heptose-7-phosphate kinase
MDDPICKIVAKHRVSASAPCRVDMGGTLDLSVFYLPLQMFGPATFNMALDLRTTVSLDIHHGPGVWIASRGFEPAEFVAVEAPFDHPLGLFFAVAAHFNLRGVRIEIESASPPRSALGGSSVAAVALIGALSECRRMAGKEPLSATQIAQWAHRLEESAAGRPCGMQDQLAAVHGGVNTWFWEVANDGLRVRRESLASAETLPSLADHCLVAYAGRPHSSHDVNGRWVERFRAGHDRGRWQRIADCVKQFSRAIVRGDWSTAAGAMNTETDQRLEMTPDALDPVGGALVEAARGQGCGGRFTGAGGGGCVWAVGEKDAIDRLRPQWQTLLAPHADASLLDAGPTMDGLTVQVAPR